MLGLPVLVSAILIVSASYGLLDTMRLQQRSDQEARKYTDAMRDWAFPQGLSRGSYRYSFVSQAGRKPHTLWFGDSHAQQYTPLITDLTDKGKLPPTLLFTGGGCAPIPNVYENNNLKCHDFIEKFGTILQENPSIEKIVITGCFNCYFVEHTKPWNTQYDYYYRDDDEIVYFKDGKGKEKAIAAFRHFIAELAADYEVIVILDNPSSAQFDPKVALQAVNRASASYFARKYPNYTPANFQHSSAQQALSHELKEALAGLNVTVFDPAPVICPQNRCQAHDAGGLPVYKDAHHIRPHIITSRFGNLAQHLAR